MPKLVSIIIPTFNNQRTIVYALESIARQTYKATETIVVDNFSSDETVTMARTYGARAVHHAGGVSSARNRGLAISKGDYILFLDGDQALEQTCLEECVSICESTGVDVVKIPETFMGLSYWGKCVALLKNVNFDLGMKRECGEGFYPRFWRRQRIAEIGGFDERLSWGEDKESYLRARKRGLVSGWSRSRIVHVDLDSLGALARKRLRYAEGIRTYRRTRSRYPNDPYDDPYVAYTVPNPSNKDPYFAYAEWGIRVLQGVLARSRDPKLLFGAFLLSIVIAGAVVLQRS